MSRLKRLKERKDRIKVIACGLALALAIGSAQGLGTYALFTDTEDISSNLSISTGDVDLGVYPVNACGLALALAIGSAQGLGTYALFTDTEDISSNLSISTGDVDLGVYPVKNPSEDTDASEKPGFQGEVIKYGNKASKEFYILNEGTLNQKVKFTLTTNSNLNDDILKDISYTLDIKNGNKTETIINTNFLEIKNKVEVDLEDFIAPGNKVNFISTISLKNSSNKIYEVKDIEFDLKILATQTGNIGSNGFYDLYDQSNYFTIGESIGGSLIAYFKNNKKEISLIEPFAILRINSLGEGKGEFESKNITGKNNLGGFLGFTISKGKEEFKTGSEGIGTNYSENQTLIVKVSCNGNTQWWKIYFRYRYGDLQAYYIVIDQPTKELQEIEIVEPPKEEIEKPSEPEAVEPPKEEVEKPSEPEAVEPPKEEVEEPSEPEVAEPPKEEVQVSIESDIVLPNQIDIIEQKKEEIDIEE